MIFFQVYSRSTALYSGAMLGRLPAIALTLSLSLIALVMIVGWIRQENEVYHELLHYQAELKQYHDKCFLKKSWEKIEHKTCPLGFISLHGKCSCCSKGSFSLLHWTSCTKFLTCEDLMSDVRPTVFLWQTNKWNYFLASWNSFHLIYTQIYNNLFPGSVNISAAWKAAAELAPHPNLLYPVGSCAASNVILYGIAEEIHPLTELDSVLEKYGCNNWMVRFKLAIDYVRILNYLHLHPSGPHVLCNSHSLNLLLSQFAVSQHFDLLLVNFDNLLNGHQPIVCSQEQLHGEFIAPEQNWPYSDYKMFNADEQPGYFHSSDIWKIPDVTKSLLGSSKESERILNYLVTLHRRCKSTDYMWRPHAKDILTEYESVWDSLIGECVSLEGGRVVFHGRCHTNGVV